MCDQDQEDQVPVPSPSGADPGQIAGGDRVRRNRLLNLFLTGINAIRVDVAAANGLDPGRPITLMDGGGSGERDLYARLACSPDPEGDLAHVLAVTRAESIRDGAIGWVQWSIVSELAWRKRRATPVAEASRRASPKRSGAFGAARPAERAAHSEFSAPKPCGEMFGEALR
ncbi:MAG: hypothetical protein ACKV2T_32835 [Kofleriaceae bacterium]